MELVRRTLPFAIAASPVPAVEWLFVRREATVRIARWRVEEGTYALRIDRADEAPAVHYFSDVIACVDAQLMMEQRLVARGFHLDRLTRAADA